jgi:hypothetical protein
VNPQPKQKRLRDKKYLEWLRSLWCCNCYRAGSENVQVVAHHIRIGTNGGTGIKPGDNHCVPLCVDCHADLHQIGEATFWENAAKNPHEVSNQFWSRYNKH